MAAGGALISVNGHGEGVKTVQGKTPHYRRAALYPQALPDALQIQLAGIAYALAPHTHARQASLGVWGVKGGKLLRDKTAQVFYCGRAQMGDFIQQAVVQQLAHLRHALAHPTQIHHHARLRVGLPAEKHLSLVSVAVHTRAALGFDLAAQGVRGIEEEALANSVYGQGRKHRRRIIAAVRSCSCAALANAKEFVALHAQLPAWAF